MSLAAPSLVVRRTTVRLVSFFVAASLCHAALAAPLSADHRFERIGYSAANVATVLQYPLEARAIVVSKNGEIRRVAGDRLVNELMGTLAVSQACDGDGVLDATWDTQTYDALYVTYISAGGTRKFTVARLPLSADGATVGAPVVLYAFNVPTTTNCTNLGGGITMAGDGKLLVGVGDMGNGPGAGQASVVTGKIWRLNAQPPGGPASDNPNPASPVYCTGVRNPVRLAYDSVSGNSWFVDVGPGMNDELNWISGGNVNYAWPRASGNFDTAGFRDPAYTWATQIVPTGLVVNAGTNFGTGAIGDAFVAAANGTMHQVHPIDLAATPVRVGYGQLFQPGTGDPNIFAGLFMPADGYAYAVTPMGEIFRLRNEKAAIAEPSDADSILPLTVSKRLDGGLDLVLEKETAQLKYGFYPGTIPTYYSHFDSAAPLLKASDCVETTGATQGCVQGDNVNGSAWSRVSLRADQVSAMPDQAYFLLSAINDRAETMVGASSARVIQPGGIQTFGCPCPDGLPVGTGDGQCAEPFTLNYGKENGVVIGPVTFDTTWDCNVILMDLSQDWCYWCHVLAPDLEDIYRDNQARGFTLLTVISENDAGGVATQATIDSWLSAHPESTNPTLLDENRRVMNRWFGTGAPPCNGFPQTHVFSCDGVHEEVICGADPTGIRAAVERALTACGR